MFKRIHLFVLSVLLLSGSDTVWAQSIAPYDIVINEIMADFSPAISLPAFEWMELYNRSSKTINLANFEISSGSSPQVLPDYELNPGDYVLVADDSDLNELLRFGYTIPVNSFPALTNGGDVITLTDENGIVIHEIVYETSWYRDGNKDNGGYSLELINPGDPCLLKDNWIASQDVSGGTPGRENSNYNFQISSDGPGIVEAFPSSANQIQVNFDKIINDNINETMFFINPSVSIVDLEIGNASDQVVLFTNTDLEVSRLYKLTVDKTIKDCIGNQAIIDQIATFIIPEELEVGDIIINEILFNPIDSGSDYIEVYNVSDKYVDLSNLKIGNINSDGIGTIKDVNQKVILEPHGYLVFTEDENDTKLIYPKSREEYLVTMDLPSFNNTEGNFSILAELNNENIILDEINYDEEMHNPFIDDPDGIALERVNPGISSSILQNWKSASKNSGFGTPTLPNSQYGPEVDLDQNHITLKSKTFTPNGDDRDDLLSINFELDQPDYLANIDVFDGNGRFIKRIASNHLMGRSDSIFWDGYDSGNNLSRSGIYVIFVKLIRSDGFVYDKKLPCVLAVKQ